VIHDQRAELLIQRKLKTAAIVVQGRSFYI